MPLALKSLAGSSLFITGGTGFIGRWLIALLLHANSELNLRLTITVLTRDAPKFRTLFPRIALDPAFRLAEGDVRSFPFPAGNFTHLIHGAAELRVTDETAPLSELDPTVGGTTRVIEFGIEKKVRRLLFPSSGAVYGFRPDTASAIPEYASPEHAVSRYGSAKQLAEAKLARAHDDHGLETVTARIFAIVGPSMPLDAHFAIGNFIRDALHRREITVSGDGGAIRSYLYAADLAAWLLQLLSHGRAGTAYNVGSDNPVSISDLAKLVAKVVPGSRGSVIQGNRGPQENSRYVPCIEKARTELGLGVWTPLEEAIERTARWAQKAL